MLKQSVLTAVILGGLAVSAGAEGEVKIEETKQMEAVQAEFVFEAPEATCQTVAAEGQDVVLDMILQEEQNASRVDDVEVAYRGSLSYCWICTFY